MDSSQQAEYREIFLPQYLGNHLHRLVLHRKGLGILGEVICHHQHIPFRCPSPSMDRKSMHTSSRGLELWMVCRQAVQVGKVIRRTHQSQVRHLAFTSSAIFGQKDRLCTKAKVWSTPICPKSSCSIRNTRALYFWYHYFLLYHTSPALHAWSSECSVSMSKKPGQENLGSIKALILLLMGMTRQLSLCRALLTSMKLPWVLPSTHMDHSAGSRPEVLNFSFYDLGVH